MATATCCVRATSQLSRLSSRPATSIQRSLHHTVDDRLPAPLYLDFLAPSWRACASNRRHTSLPVAVRTNSPPKSQIRHFSLHTRRQAKVVTNARKDDDGNDMMINITPRAAHRLQAIAEKDKNNELALRVSVESGGCHGFQYLMKLINMPEVDKQDDTVFENDDIGGDDYRARVVMDEPSLELLKGSSIDYTMELIGSQFKVTGIPGAKSSCGCGTSFDIAE